MNMPVLKNLINKFHIVGEISYMQASECPLHIRRDGTPGPVYDVTCILPPLQHVAVMCNDRRAYTCSAMH